MANHFQIKVKNKSKIQINSTKNLNLVNVTIIL